jgi:polyisoprenyl-teichoic acid--peptidoglycan teichoic acid transferase
MPKKGFDEQRKANILKAQMPKAQTGRAKKRNSGKPLIFGIIAVISGTLGASLALALASSPFRHSASALPNNSQNITTIIPTNLDRPVNILVLGVDSAGYNHIGSYTPVEALSGNSDTMLLIRILPKTHQVNVLSIPRDTRVEIPGFGPDKINAANVDGGVSLSAKTVSGMLRDIPIDRYIRVDTEGFTHLVDALGGVEINVPKPMDYVDRTQKLHIHFLTGRQVLNGKQLQEYVRFRHDELGDIGRVQRQQEIVKALLHKLIQPYNLGKLQQILQVFQQNIDSDLSLGEMFAIAQELKGIDRNHFNLVMLPGRFSQEKEYKSSYWIANNQATDLLLTRYFDAKIPTDASTSSLPTASSTTDKASKTMQIAVANATNHPELAEKVVRFLTSRGFNNVYMIDREINAILDSTQETQIIAQQGNPDFANLLKQEIGIGQVQVAATGDIYSDVTLVVREDMIAKFK